MLKIGPGQIDLLAGRLGLVDDGAEAGVFGAVLGVPAEVLACDAHAGFLAVEGVEGFEMADQDVSNFIETGFGEPPSSFQIVTDFAEDPGTSLRAAADQQAVGAGVVEDGFGFFRGVDVAVGPDRDAEILLDSGDRVVLGLAAVFLVAGAAVDGQGLDAGLLGDAGDDRGVLLVGGPARADLQGHGHVDGSDHGLQDGLDQGLVLHQGRTRPGLADFLGRAAHVDVDQVGTQLNVVASGFGETLGDRAGNLHADRLRLADVVHSLARFARVPEFGVRGGHLGGGQARAHAFAQ